MRNTVKLELRKAIKNKFFLASVVIGCVVTIFSALYKLTTYYNGLETTRMSEIKMHMTYNPMQRASNLFNCWIGGEAFTLASTVFFFIFPILVAIPYGWSYCMEKKSGYVRSMVLRSGKGAYYGAKYIAVFISGGLAMVIPLVFNLMLVAMFVPASTPSPAFCIYYGVWASSLMSTLLYTQPFLYVLLYLLIDFLFCGLIACISYAGAVLVKNRVAVVLLPFLILLAVHYSRALSYGSTAEISPMFFLRPAPIGNDAVWWAILLEAGILFVITFAMTVVRGRKNEVY